MIYECWRQDVDMPLMHEVEFGDPDDPQTVAVLFVSENWRTWEQIDSVEVGVREANGKLSSWTVDIDTDPSFDAFENEWDDTMKVPQS